MPDDERRRSGKRQMAAKQCAEMRRQSGSIRLNPTRSGWGQSTDGTDYTDCASGVIGFHPTRSDQIRPEPGESDRMKPITDCNCTMDGAARVPVGALVGALAADATERGWPCVHLLTSVATGVCALPGRRSFGGVFQNEPKWRPRPNPKTAFFTGRRTFHFQSNLRDETCFYETNPNREKCELASTDC